jgi:hypothetical protein
MNFKQSAGIIYVDPELNGQIVPAGMKLLVKAAVSYER